MNYPENFRIKLSREYMKFGYGICVDINELTEGDIETKLLFRKCITSRERMWAMLYFKEGHTYKDISELCSVSVSTVQQDIRRCLIKLATVIFKLNRGVTIYNLDLYTYMYTKLIEFGISTLEQLAEYIKESNRKRIPGISVEAFSTIEGSYNEWVEQEGLVFSELC